MTVLTIRSHKRYAVRQSVGLAKSGCRTATGLLIELSSEGFRISNLGRGEYTVGEAVTVELEELRLPGRIRWAHDGVAGVRLDVPLFSGQLQKIVVRNREADPVMRYGT